MQCPSCNSTCDDDQRFCADCGAALTIACGACAFVNKPSAKFCGGCGKPLTRGPTAPPAAPSRPSRPGAAAGDRQEGERRQLTVMFCDLVGSTSLSGRLDPEDFRDVLLAYQHCVAQVAGQYEGHVAKYIGDGVLVYFGYPQAHEDDAQRAVRAGLGILAAIAQLSQDMEAEIGTPLAVHIGIHTGIVVTGEMGAGGTREEMAIVGETPNVAARLEELAKPGEVLISERTHQLVDGLFEFAFLGTKPMRGLSSSLGVYRVIAEESARSRFDVVASKGLTPMVGREEEIGLLLKRWGQSKDGEGQVILLSGEAGLGKSRILRDFRSTLVDEAHSRLLFSGSPYHSSSALHPVIEQMLRWLRISADDVLDEKFDKLEQGLGAIGCDVSDAAPILASMLSLPLEHRYPPLALGPQQLRKRTIEILLDLVERLARQRPVLVIVEDAHWIDPSTTEFIGHLIEQVRSKRVLMVITHRPDFEPPWPYQPHIMALSMNNLSQRESLALIAKVPGTEILPRYLCDKIIEHADGVPLYLEELVKTVLESEDLQASLRKHGNRLGPLPSLAIPTSLQDSLMARLDRLGSAKETAQLAATMGRNFSQDLLTVISPLSAEDLGEALDRLVNSGLAYRRGLPPNASYEFKHAMVRDTAYGSLLKAACRQNHLLIARGLEAHFPDIVETQPEVLAHHLTMAGQVEKAIDYWEKAGRRAAARSANIEAIDHLEQALSLLQKLPASNDRNERELGLQITLAVPLTATRGYAAPEVERSYTRARALCQEIGDSHKLFPTLYGLWRFFLLRADYAVARELGEQLRALADGSDNPYNRVASYRAMGATQFYLGELLDAKISLDQVMAFERPEEHDESVLLYDVVDAQVTGFAYAAWTVWSLGYPDKAKELSQESIDLARRLSHPFTLALALSFATWLHQFCGEVEMTIERAEEGIRLSNAYSFPFWTGWCKVMRGWAKYETDGSEEGFAELREGLETWQSTGSRLGLTYFLALEAEVVGAREGACEGLDLVEDALRMVEQTDERWWQSEVLRLKGKLLLALESPDAAGAERCFRQALAVAGGQRAMSLELRAALSLADHLSAQGRAGEGRTLLAEVCGRADPTALTPELTRAREALSALETAV
jgi:class 3 adenylate cyclase/predicted ATPase